MFFFQSGFLPFRLAMVETVAAMPSRTGYTQRQSQYATGVSNPLLMFTI
jgi:hypothetical protein